MIRVKKDKIPPASLSKKKSYRGADVLKQIKKDQNGKCYICEREMGTNFEVEHLKSQANNKNQNLKFDWNNLYGACGYCNKRKSNKYDDILDPKTENIELAIIQKVDYINNRAYFRKRNLNDIQKENAQNKTVSLLKVLYNGKNPKYGRTVDEEEFWNKAVSIVEDFQNKINAYMQDSSNKNRDVIVCDLQQKKELLGFKYWMIRRNKELYKEFGKAMNWNRL